MVLMLDRIWVRNRIGLYSVWEIEAMGYTHYWQYHRDITANEWKEIRGVFRRLVSSLPGIALAGPEGDGEPRLDAIRLIFNGASPHAVEPFAFYRTRAGWDADHKHTLGRPWRGYCKTEHQPYDLAVMTMLLSVRDIAQGALSVESDEDMNGLGWSQAMDLARRLRG